VLGLTGFAGATNLDPADGWVQLNDGYWERLTADGKLQTVAIGSAGLEQVLANLNADMVMLVEQYLANPNDDMLATLDAHLTHIDIVKKNLEMSRATKAAIPVPVGWCNVNWSADAGGGPGCINWAEAAASYSGSSPDDCFGLCDLSAYAYASRVLCNHNEISQSHSCFRNDVINDQCDVYASVSSSAARSCYSYASAYVSCPDTGYYRSETDTSTICGLCMACKEVSHEEAVD
jgi:hypothetical protein